MGDDIAVEVLDPGDLLGEWKVLQHEAARAAFLTTSPLARANAALGVTKAD